MEKDILMLLSAGPADEYELRYALGVRGHGELKQFTKVMRNLRQKQTIVYDGEKFAHGSMCMQEAILELLSTGPATMSDMMQSLDDLEDVWMHGLARAFERGLWELRKARKVVHSDGQFLLAADGVDAAPDAD